MCYVNKYTECIRDEFVAKEATCIGFTYESCATRCTIMCTSSTRLSAVAPQFEIQESKVCLSYIQLSFSLCRTIS